MKGRALDKKTTTSGRDADRCFDATDMKFSEFLKLTESSQELDKALKSVREYIRKPNSGVSGEGKKTCEKIIDTLLAYADDKKTFKRYYNKFMADHPDTMDFVLDEVYSQMQVHDAEEFFAKAFNRADVKVT